jgi:hypothetical protein
VVVFPLVDQCGQGDDRKSVLVAGHRFGLDPFDRNAGAASRLCARTDTTGPVFGFAGWVGAHGARTSWCPRSRLVSGSVGAGRQQGVSVDAAGTHQPEHPHPHLGGFDRVRARAMTRAVVTGGVVLLRAGGLRLPDCTRALIGASDHRPSIRFLTARDSAGPQVRPSETGGLVSKIVVSVSRREVSARLAGEMRGGVDARARKVMGESRIQAETGHLTTRPSGRPGR